MLNSDVQTHILSFGHASCFFFEVVIYMGFLPADVGFGHSIDVNSFFLESLKSCNEEWSPVTMSRSLMSM